MHYVKQFNINGVDTKQVACIELQGVPNAATEGAVGVLGMDMTSPTHDVYKCVAVNGSIYTWELLAGGFSVISATVTGEGAKSKTFSYDNLLVPNGYLIKVGDLILDSEAYLYKIDSIGASSCNASYCGTHIGGVIGGGKDYNLTVKKGKLQLVTESGNVKSEVEYTLADGDTIYRDSSTGEVTAIGIRTINGTALRFFVGTKNEYNALTDAQKNGLFAIITDDTTKDALDKVISDVDTLKKGLANGSVVVNKATTAGNITGILAIKNGGTGTDNRRTAVDNLFCLGLNPIQTENEDTPANWKQLGSGWAFYDSIAQKDVKLKDMPSSYGTIISFVNGEEIFQIWKNPQDNLIYTRTGNNQEDWLTSFGSYAHIAEIAEIANYASSNTSKGTIENRLNALVKKANDIITENGYKTTTVVGYATSVLDITTNKYSYSGTLNIPYNKYEITNIILKSPANATLIQNPNAGNVKVEGYVDSATTVKCEVTYQYRLPLLK